MHKVYTGIGSRIVPLDIATAMTEFAVLAQELDWTLRSGAAVGSDAAFERGTTTEAEIYLPWKGFNKHPSQFFAPSEAAFKLAATIHPNYRGLQPVSRLLLARNMHQVFGADMKSPTEFVICWTPDGTETHKQYGRKTGGTGSAIAAASLAGIPVFNLRNEGRYQEAVEYLINLSGR